MTLNDTDCATPTGHAGVTVGCQCSFHSCNLCTILVGGVGNGEQELCACHLIWPYTQNCSKN